MGVWRRSDINGRSTAGLGNYAAAPTSNSMTKKLRWNSTKMRAMAFPLASQSIACRIRARCRQNLKVSPVSTGNRRLNVRTEVAARDASSSTFSRFWRSSKARSTRSWFGPHRAFACQDEAGIKTRTTLNIMGNDRCPSGKPTSGPQRNSSRLRAPRSRRTISRNDRSCGRWP